MLGAAREQYERASRTVTASGMDCGSAAGERQKHPRGRRRLMLFQFAGLCGSPGGRYLSTPPGGLGALRRGGASRVRPLLLLLSPPPRPPPADWGGSRPASSAAPARRGGAWSCPPGLVPGVACAAGAPRPIRGRVAALASSRRGEAGRPEEVLASRGRRGSGGNLRRCGGPEGAAAEVAGRLRAWGLRPVRSARLGRGSPALSAETAGHTWSPRRGVCPLGG